ncbi:uncharacterized protein G2W53_019959 [Senna tora]|uniref:Uncharacterized protein n=1 Tax=Senna tora TaxID=362788 RepID=A0A834TUG1_9FABA|nr:uncharacterized protein G2W53_019959 [Senna tora]
MPRHATPFRFRGAELTMFPHYSCTRQGYTQSFIIYIIPDPIQLKYQPVYKLHYQTFCSKLF